MQTHAVSVTGLSVTCNRNRTISPGSSGEWLKREVDFLQQCLVSWLIWWDMKLCVYQSRQVYTPWGCAETSGQQSGQMFVETLSLLNMPTQNSAGFSSYLPICSACVSKYQVLFTCASTLKSRSHMSWHIHLQMLLHWAIVLGMIPACLFWFNSLHSGL